MEIGVKEPFFRPSIRAPISVNGSVTLVIGLFPIDSSPTSDEKKGLPASIPINNRIVVPELPTSNTSVGSVNPSKPFPIMRS